MCLGLAWYSETTRRQESARSSRSPAVGVPFLDGHPFRYFAMVVGRSRRTKAYFHRLGVILPAND
jgi:hypothetical protein